MSDLFARMGEFAARLLAGGTLEIVLLIVLIVVGLILLLVALWVLWKLAVLLGKGLLALFRTGEGVARKRTAERRAARLAAPPAVATGWGSAPRIRLRKAIAEARRLVGPDALSIVVLAGDGVSDLCRSLGLTPPAVAEIGIAAGGDVILIDATQADSGRLRALASALPWRRPVDGVATLVNVDGIPAETLVRAVAFSRAAGLRLALHFVLAGTSAAAVWRVIDSGSRDGADLCAQLAQDTARVWLGGGSRDGLKELSLAQSTDLATAVDRALAAAPASAVDVASLSVGGAGLRSAVAQTAARTRPAEAPGLTMWLGLGGLAVGLGLTVLVAVTGVERAADLRSTVATASREAATPWLTTDIDALPGGSRVRRVAGVSARLAGFSDFSALMPLSVLVPNFGAPARLGGSMLEAYVLRPLAASLNRQARERLFPSEDPVTWLAEAQLVGEWLAAWEGLADDPREVDPRRLLADAFGGTPDSWPDGLDLALLSTDVQPPVPARGGLDVDALTELARQNFIATMQLWAESVYTNGPVADAARRAIDRSATWRLQHAALTELRTALQDPGQTWLTAAEDRPDYGFELRMLGRALALSVLGEASALEAKAAVSRIRIDARDAAEYFLLPDIGPLLARAGSGTRGGGGGPSLTLTPQATAWLAFLDRIASAGFADLPQQARAVVAGPVTIDPAAVLQTLGKLRTFDRFAANLPANLPPAVAEDLLREVASELVIGVAASVDSALRPAVAAVLAGEEATRLLRLTPALEGLAEIESWLRQRGAAGEADRVLEARWRVAENVLAVGEQVLAEEDPLGLFLDPAADANALVRRFDRGLVRLRRLHEQFGAPYVAAGTLGGRAIAFRWRDIGEDIDGYDRGDASSALSGLEGMARAFADDSETACGAPRAAHAAARDDYVARALSRFRVQVDGACVDLDLARSERAHESLRDEFHRNVAWMWPYSRDANAPELPGSTLAGFVGRLHEARAASGAFQGTFGAVFQRSADFWQRDEAGAAVLRFRVEWRARPGEEELAEHVIAFDFEGLEQDEGGVYTWRYGTPAALRLRLARHSPYRFADPADAEGLEFVRGGSGNGAVLRIFEGLAGGAFEIGTEVVDERGARLRLRVTARIAGASGTPLTLPRFHEFPQGGAPGVD